MELGGGYHPKSHRTSHVGAPRSLQEGLNAVYNVNTITLMSVDTNNVNRLLTPIAKTQMSKFRISN